MTKRLEQINKPTKNDEEIMEHLALIVYISFIKLIIRFDSRA